MLTPGQRAPKPIDRPSDKQPSDPSPDPAPPSQEPHQDPLRPGLDQPPSQTSQPPLSPIPELWIELLPIGVQYRIAEYVSEAISGLDALNLAKTSFEQSQVVSTSLNYFLVNNFATHAQELVNDWNKVCRNVRVLELWEHPPNFVLLSSPSLETVVLEDEPMQLDALTTADVDICKIEFYARYDTPTHIIVSMFQNVSFCQLELHDINSTFFTNVNIPSFAKACKRLTKLIVSTAASNQDAVADFIDRIPTITRLLAIIDGVEISFRGLLLPNNGEVTGLGLYINKVRWFESLEFNPQLKQLWLMSDRGWGENEVLQFSCAILDFPTLAALTVKLRPGSERFFPRISSLEQFHAYWNGDVDLSDAEQLYYKPQQGVITRIMEGMPLLTNLKLSAIRLAEHEVIQVIKTVGPMIEAFGMSMDRQDVSTIERLLTVIQVLTRYAPCLEDFNLCQRNERGVPIYDPCETPITPQRKQEMLLHLDRLHRRVPQVLLGHVETSILDWPEEDPENQKDNSVQNEALQNAFVLRRCRRGMNESGDPVHMWTLAKLLETGCEGLERDRDAAIELYKQAVWLGDSGDALLNLWRFTEDPNDTSTEPKPGGAFELILELDRTGFKKLPVSAEVFLNGTESTSANTAAAAKLLQIAVDRGFIHMCCIQLASLAREGYNGVPPDPYKSFDLYQLAIDEDDDADAMFKIADMLKHGYGDEPPNPAAARKHLERGVQLGWAPCMNDLAVLLKEGYDNVAPDTNAAVELYNRAIADGNTVAMSNLASVYVERGCSDISNIPKAMELYERSISEGQNAHAMVLLGNIHREGYGDVPPNLARAKELYVQATEWGEHKAYTYLGTLVAEGYDNVPPDPHEAIRLYQLAIDTADGRDNMRSQAMYAYAQLLLQGNEHLVSDLSAAIELFRWAADEGDIPALCKLAELYEDGAPGLSPDPVEACRLYNRAIEEGRDGKAMRKLGGLLERGYGDVKPDPYGAERLYREAMFLNDAEACYSLGDLLERGYGEELSNPTEALIVYEIGVERDNPDCMCGAGSLLERGFLGRNRLPETAIKLYRRAIEEHNSTKAMCLLGMTLAEGYLDNQPDYKAAAELYKRASQTDSWALIHLAKLVEDGYDDIEPDRERAKNLFKEVLDEKHKSCPQSRAAAMRGLGRIIEKSSGDHSKQLMEAADWYRKAIDTCECAYSLYDLAALLVKGYEDVNPDVHQAIYLLKKSISYGTCCQPFFLLARCVGEGYGDVKPDPVESRRLEEEGCLLLWSSMHI